MNAIFFAIVLISFVIAGYNQITWIPAADAVAPMQALAAAMVDSATGSVTLAIGLIGVMALFLGLMKVAEEGGLLVIIAKTIRPLMVRAFPEVPADHPAMGAMILNFAANALGLGNAATPFGIRAMQELDRLNPHKGTASNAMVLFLAINTSSVTLLPTGVIALRAAAGSADPAGILPTTLFATIVSTTVAVIATKFYQRFTAAPGCLPAAQAGGQIEPAEDPDELPTVPPEAASGAYPGWVTALAFGAIAALVPVSIVFGKTISPWIIPGLMVGLLGFGAGPEGARLRGVRRRRPGRFPGRHPHHSLPGGDPGGGGHAARQRGDGNDGDRVAPADQLDRAARRGVADGAVAAAVRVRRLRGAGLHHPGSRHWAGQQYGLSGEYLPGLHRDHVLRDRGLFRGRPDPPHPPRAGGGADRRRGRHRRRHRRLPLSLWRLSVRLKMK
jgi:spore maturation protein SpmA